MGSMTRRYKMFRLGAFGLYYVELVLDYGLESWSQDGVTRCTTVTIHRCTGCAVC